MSPINANAGEYRSTIGLKDLYIAEVTQDDATGYVADTPEYLAPAADISHEPSQSTVTQYADDIPYDVMYSEGETKITMSITGLPAEMLAKITGRVFDAASGRVFDNGGTPPYCALSFRSVKSNGSYRYYQYLKGRFEMPKGEATTKSDSPAPKTTQLTFTAIFTVYEFDTGSVDESVKRVFGDEDTTNFSGATWFSQVQTPVAVAPSALALSSSDPTDNDTGVAVNKTITLTFNNALLDGEIYHVVLASAAGAIKDCTNSLDATKKIMTVNPDTNMASSTVHLCSIGVTDIYGQHLLAVVNFTTA